ncbi:MAG: protein-L-isoaspartate(D-aspartate) O-methyltransferase [Candidatus Melainabacteria bacterium]|nr:protein-L-isoaspartate(D-aspartate) O-methyltransferase [Candidatus Melainabacteria bacterium]
MKIQIWSATQAALIAFLALVAPSWAEQLSNKPIDPGWDKARQAMATWQIAQRGISDERVLEAMKTVPRHLFIPPEHHSEAYQDGPVPIGWGQTISQPYIVAYMTEALRLKPSDRVLEIGTGCGYQAAVLAKLVRQVYTIEIIEPLGLKAQALLQQLGYKNIKVAIGDGYLGWPKAAPFDAIIVTAAPDHIPQALTNQLALNGRLVIPLGKTWQSLVRITRTSKGLTQETLLPVRFVPMTGQAQKH